MRNTEGTKSTGMDLRRPLASLVSDITSDGDTTSVDHKAAIGLGSNLGDRFANIEHALRLLENPQRLVDPTILGENAQVFIMDTSFLYETTPMYVTDQPSFINCACLVRSLSRVLRCPIVTYLN
jgi:dihydroneopterin aldolase / 2-amino-4-hydroxy-6-hydroxymethyldihydropteridine diphosphokinase / dihydropteroate synthase